MTYLSLKDTLNILLLKVYTNAYLLILLFIGISCSHPSKIWPLKPEVN